MTNNIIGKEIKTNIARDLFKRCVILDGIKKYQFLSVASKVIYVTYRYRYMR